MTSFNLKDYIPEIKKIAAATNVDSDTAMLHFIANMAVMREFYPGASESLHYGQLGQAWNSLTGEERNRQKAAVRVLLNKSTNGGIKL